MYELQKIKKSIGVPLESKLILSVGELNKNKNHEAVIRALALLEDEDVHYAIAGIGNLHEYLENLAKGLGIADRVHLLDYRTDVVDLYKTADLFIHPSLREGLPVALMEAIASKIPVICSNIRGNIDLVSGNALFEAENVEQIFDEIKFHFDKDYAEEVKRNYSNLIKYDLEMVSEDMKMIYK